MKFILSVIFIVSVVSGRRIYETDDAGCKGRLDWARFAKVNQICEECYSLFKEMEVYQLCRQQCFGTKIFTGCMEALLVEEELKSDLSTLISDAHASYYDPLTKK